MIDLLAALGAVAIMTGACALVAHVIGRLFLPRWMRR